jgi:hypothetical protein
VAQRPAWRGLEAHESGVRWSALQRLEQRSVAMEEQRQTARAEWSGWAFGGYRGKRREWCFSDRQRDEVMHGAAAACVACGADVVAGGQRR